ncbi:hypothetical protein V5O48_003717 [Marasmius crinis-equi]|uniref:Uncharacterized protein n=1 Tax=Marasmius crinis-equi TaxID=585013 RepID=A0ABR3FS31_9AGAR
MSRFHTPSISSNTRLPTSRGIVDVAKLQISCRGDELLDLLTRITASNPYHAEEHEVMDMSIRRFLRGPPSRDLVVYSPSLRDTHGYEMPDFATDRYYTGLQCNCLHLKWKLDERGDAPERPPTLGVVPCFHTQDSLIADNSLVFGTPIIGDGRRFKKAILLQLMDRVGCWQYILAQTERPSVPIYVRVPVRTVVPYWPYMHSPRLLLLAEIAPILTGLSKPGLENIKKAADECYRPSFSVQLEPLNKESPAEDEQSSTGTTSLQRLDPRTSGASEFCLIPHDDAHNFNFGPVLRTHM